MMVDTRIGPVSFAHVCAPMPHEISLAKPRFKDKIKNFNTAVKSIMVTCPENWSWVRQRLCMVS